MKNIFKAIIFFFILITVSSCGSRFWYNTIDFFILRSLDQYFDITREQKSYLKEKLEYNLNFHREKGISQHIAFLKSIQTRVQKGIQKEDVKWFYEELSNQVDLISARLSDVLVDFLMTLQPEQVDHFERKLIEQNEKNKKQQEKHAKDEEERSEEIIESFEEWLGPLNDIQKKKILELVGQMPDNQEEVNNNSLERQRNFVTALRHVPRDREEIEKRLSEYIADTQSDDESVAMVTDFVIKVDRLITPEQRAHLIKRLDKWVDRLEAVEPE